MKELRIKLRVLAASFGLDYLDDWEFTTNEDGEPTLVLHGTKQ